MVKRLGEYTLIIVFCTVLLALAFTFTLTKVYFGGKRSEASWVDNEEGRPTFENVFEKYGDNLGLFFGYFRPFIITFCAWGSNLGPLDGRHRRIRWAMAAT